MQFVVCVPLGALRLYIKKLQGDPSSFFILKKAKIVFVEMAKIDQNRPNGRKSHIEFFTCVVQLSQ